MDQKELKTSLLELLKEYQAYCDEQSKKIAKDKKDDRVIMLPMFDGFIEWLENGEVK